LLVALRHGLIVSCQAEPDEPLYGPEFMAAMARAAVMGGAVAIRANGPADIAAIRSTVTVPIIGLYKANLPDFDVRITPTLDHVKEIVAAGADIIALDATARPRPDGGTASDFIARVRAVTRCPVVADVATVEEGLAAAEAGAEAVATTLSGYTSNSPSQIDPDFDLIKNLSPLLQAKGVPLIAEGRIATPEQVARAIALGAYTVVVGGAITRPQWITEHFVAALNHAPHLDGSDR